MPPAPTHRAPPPPPPRAATARRAAAPARQSLSPHLPHRGSASPCPWWRTTTTTRPRPPRRRWRAGWRRAPRAAVCCFRLIFGGFWPPKICGFPVVQVLEDATCRFSSRNKLGSGGFGTVYKGTLENGMEVAVKRLRDSKRTIQELEREISIVANLHHKNLVRFLGYCFQEEGRFLVYEYVPNNSLDKFWYKASFQGEKLEWATWFNIILGVARGLRFLHDKGIIHRDLKPHNVLLDDNFNPKIADFDLMRMYDKQKTHESTEKVAGTFGYMAPECTSGRKFLLSIKSDVYSYGVLVLEIITGHKIYTFEGQDSEGLVEYVWQHWTEKRASDVVDGDLGVEGQEHAARQALRCVHVALLCVQSDRARRPTMGQVIAMLSSGDDGAEELPEPSLPGYVVRPTAASGAQLCFGCR